MLIFAQVLRGSGPSLYGVNQQTLRLTYIVPQLISRTQATWRFLVYGMQAIGALLGGLLASTVGLRATLAIGSVGLLIGTVVAFLSPLRTVRDLSNLPAPTEQAEAA